MVSAGLSPREAVRRVEARLAAAGCPDADYDARELFRAASGRDARLSDRVLTTEEAEKLENLCTRREQREPLQYLCGIWSFLDFDLAVGPGVLCPRADTEVVAEAAANTLTGIAAPRVLDLCAGTGAIGLAVGRVRPDARVTLVERSPDALPYCRENAGQAAQVMAADVFGCERALEAERFDCIVCNPPYVTEEEYARLEPELLFEPKEALVAREQGLAFYAYIAPRYRDRLAPGGALVFEIGAAQREAVQAILARSGYEEIGGERDLGGNDRCVWGRRPGVGARG